MKLIKGVIYEVKKSVYQLNNRAEYHSTFLRKTDAKPLHHFIAYDVQNDLNVFIYTNEEIIKVSPTQEL